MPEGIYTRVQGDKVLVHPVDPNDLVDLIVHVRQFDHGRKQFRTDTSRGSIGLLVDLGLARLSGLVDVPDDDDDDADDDLGADGDASGEAPAPSLPEPPRHGNGSGVNAWRAFLRERRFEFDPTAPREALWEAWDNRASEKA